MQEIDLYWHDYRYFPYERELGEREARRLISAGEWLVTPWGFRIIADASISSEELERLVYFRGFSLDAEFHPTIQWALEKASSNPSTQRKQATRYSVHGIHEYKGKFNPQIVRGVLNILGTKPGDRVLDPFCGSGTSLVECVHGGIQTIGFDLNPLAVYISNAKLDALATPVEYLRNGHQAIMGRIHKDLRRFKENAQWLSTQRLEYLSRWFDTGILSQLEYLRDVIIQEGGANSSIFLVLASDLLREYSLQDPSDLRIRRRRTPLPEKPLLEAFENKVHQFLENLAATQIAVGIIMHRSRAIVHDSRMSLQGAEERHDISAFDAALTSPPYATALPYIDTQRLSLVWLDLCTQADVKRLEAMLTGSREFIQDQREMWDTYLASNGRDLPPHLHDFCLKLQTKLIASDGFRRQAVPLLLYRYLSDMKDSFASVFESVKRNAHYALVVGHNHSVLGGDRIDMDTPSMLTDIALSCGWGLTSTIGLQTYQRYGIHNANAVRNETLLILRRP